MSSWIAWASSWKTVEVVRPQPRVDVGLPAEVERRADLGALGAHAHDAGIAASAENETERVDEDRLAGPRLAGEHAEAGRKVDLELVDEDEVADGESAQHRHGGSGSCTEVRGTAQRRRAARRP